jgi:hypothetical protein
MKTPRMETNVEFEARAEARGLMGEVSFMRTSWFATQRTVLDPVIRLRLTIRLA